jgi:antitoxin (DNA-binding transcriptional repressor) of toxin-antitoxin stability system
MPYMYSYLTIEGNFKLRTAKSIRIICDPENQRPEKWSSAVTTIWPTISETPCTTVAGLNKAQRNQG